jgi:DnaJ family protein C protein 28
LSDIEEHIRRAIESGKFNDLLGKGKPLNLDDDLWVDSDWRLAHHMLKSAGYTLPWIEMLKEIDLEIETARLALRRAWEYRKTSLASKDPASEADEECRRSQADAECRRSQADAECRRSQADAEWQRAVQAFKDQAAKLNKRIFDFNLQVPSEKFQRLQLNPEQEIKKVKSVI